MPEIDELFKLAASDFETADSYFKEIEAVLYTLKAKLDDCSERLARLAHEETIFVVKSDNSIDNSQPSDTKITEEAVHAISDKLEVCFNQLAKFSADKFVDDCPTTDNEELRPVNLQGKVL